MSKFVTKTARLDPWYETVQKEVFLHGACATCLACKNKEKGPERFQCADCKGLKTAEHFLRNESSLQSKNTNENREQVICLTHMLVSSLYEPDLSQMPVMPRGIVQE